MLFEHEFQKHIDRLKGVDKVCKPGKWTLLGQKRQFPPLPKCLTHPRIGTLAQIVHFELYVPL